MSRSACGRHLHRRAADVGHLRHGLPDRLLKSVQMFQSDTCESVTWSARYCLSPTTSRSWFNLQQKSDYQVRRNLGPVHDGDPVGKVHFADVRVTDPLQMLDDSPERGAVCHAQHRLPARRKDRGRHQAAHPSLISGSTSSFQ